jgi:hypothetical protein
MPIRYNLGPKRPATIIHVDDPDETLEPHLDRPLPLDKRIKLDARIRVECVEIIAIDDLRPNSRNAKKHPDRQIALLRENFEKFGFTNPILVDEKNKILAGHARYIAAKQAGFAHLPVIRHSHLSQAKKRAFAIADNKLAELGEWDLEILSEELSFLFDPETELEFDPRVIGFETSELDQILCDEDDDSRADTADEIVPINPQEPAVTNTGDVWICDQHRLTAFASSSISKEFTRSRMPSPIRSQFSV